MANWLRKAISLGSPNNIIQSSEVHIEKNFSNWEIPKENLTKIYHIGITDFKTAFSIKTHEETRSIQKESETMHLLSESSIKAYLKHRFRFIHFGLVQIGIKPLVHKGVDCPIFLALRDDRLNNYKDSVLAMIQTNICNGPIYFNCFPNFTVDLQDPLILSSLILDIQILNNKFKEFARNFAIVFRVYFRLMNSTVNPKFIHEASSKEETIFIEVHAENTKSIVSTAKTLRWDQISIPETFQFSNPMPPRNIRQEIECIEEDENKVLIRFGSMRELSSSPCTSSSNYPRRSFSFPQKTTSVISEPIKVRYKSPIPEYEANASQTSQISSSRPASPTMSDMQNFDSINTITKDFEIDKNYLRDEFNSSHNAEHRDWFRSFSRSFKDSIRDVWYKDMNTIQINIPFFTWFLLFCEKQGIANPYSQNHIFVQTKLQKNWVLKDGQTISSVHPPLQNITFPYYDREIKASPFKEGRVDQTDKTPNVEDIIKIYHQNNFTNQILHTVATQVDQLSNKVDNLQKETSRSIAPNTIASLGSNKVSAPHFKPPGLTIPMTQMFPKNGFTSSNSNSAVLDKIQKSLQKLADSPSHIKVLSKYQSSEISSDEENSESLIISKVAKQFQESDNDPHQINKIRSSWKNIPTKNYYPRPTPVDLQYEERSTFTSKSFSPDMIHEWNIDGKSDYEILNTLQNMGMAIVAYKAKPLDEQIIFGFIISGFTGQLKNWWDNLLTLQDRLEILNHVTDIMDDQGNVFQKSDCCDFLIIVIAFHFVGNPTQTLSSGETILQNLRCPTLSDYRWYKDTFFSYVLQRQDCNQSFWKEKFISGLPKLFAQRIFRKIAEHDTDKEQALNNTTYGGLFAFIKKEGLSLCEELKLQAKYTSEKKQSRKEIGCFCEAFGMEAIRAPSTKKKIKKQFSKFSKDKNKNSYPSYYRKKRGKKNFGNFRKSNKAFKIFCYSCGKPGHKANACTTKKKIQELFINDSELGDKISKILLQTPESTSSSSSEKEDDEILQINDQTSDSESSISSSPIKCINVLTDKEKNVEFLFDLVDKIQDKEIKRETLLKLKTMVLGETSTSKNKESIPIPQIEPFNISKLLEKYSSKEMTSKLIPIKNQTLSVKDLQLEINKIKEDIISIKNSLKHLEIKDFELETKLSILENPIYKENLSLGKEKVNGDDDDFITVINKINFQKWYAPVTFQIGDFQKTYIALIDSGADQNCLREGLVPTKFYEKTKTRLYSANSSPMDIKYKISKGKIINENYSFTNTFIIINDIKEEIILGTPFLTQIYPFWVDDKGVHTKILGKQLSFPFLSPMLQKDINLLQNSSVIQSINLIKQKEFQISSLKEEISFQRIEEQLQQSKLQQKIFNLENIFKSKVCADIPNAIWDRKRHIVTLPYEKDFSEKNIPTKARPIQMNSEHLEFCKKEIQTLLDKKLITPSKSPWSCAAFYVMNAAEKERGVPRLVINYKPLNKVLQWIRYPIPNKRDLINRLYKAKIFSKFDMKSGFWQIQIAKEDRYKTAFTVPFGHYEWNVMPFGLKNAPSEFQHIMNDIFNQFSSFIIVYIDDVLIFSHDIDQHFKHLHIFLNTVEKNGLVVSATKMKLFQTKIRFLGHDIYKGTIKPITRSLEFAEKFPNEIKDKTQLQRFLGCLNYISDFFPKLRQICMPLFQRLQKNPPPWSEIHTKTIIELKQKIKSLPCLGIPDPSAFMIVETDASEIGYGGILKQRIDTKEQLVRFHSGLWLGPQKNYSTIKKEILSIVLCVSKFQDDLYNKKFLIRIDCKSAKEVLEKDVKNIVSKQIFARWQAILSVFDFQIEHIRGESNSLPDFLTREFLQGHHNAKEEESARKTQRVPEFR